MNIWLPFLFRLAIEAGFASLLLFAFLHTRKRFKKSACQTRIAFFVPLVWLFLFLSFSWFSFLPKLLDVHSMSFSLVYSEEVQVQSVNALGRIYTDQGSFLLLGHQSAPVRDKRYRIRYLPWSRCVTALEELDPTVKNIDSN